MADLLLIESDPQYSETLARTLENAGFGVMRHPADKAPAEHELARVDGILGSAAVLEDDETLHRLASKPLIVLDRRASVRRAVRAMKLGAADYLADELRAGRL